MSPELEVSRDRSEVWKWVAMILAGTVAGGVSYFLLDHVLEAQGLARIEAKLEALETKVIETKGAVDANNTLIWNMHAAPARTDAGEGPP